MECLFTVLTLEHQRYSGGSNGNLELRAARALKSTGLFLVWNSKTDQITNRTNLPLNLLPYQQGTRSFKSGHWATSWKHWVLFWATRTGEVGSVSGGLYSKGGPKVAIHCALQNPHYQKMWKRLHNLWPYNTREVTMDTSWCSQGLCRAWSHRFSLGPEQVDWTSVTRPRRSSWWHQQAYDHISAFQLVISWSEGILQNTCCTPSVWSTSSPVHWIIE